MGVLQPHEKAFGVLPFTGFSRKLANLGVAPEMADEEHPEGSGGGGGGQERTTKGRTRQNEPSPPDPGQGEAVSATIASASAAPAGLHSGTSPADDSSAVYAPPPPAGTSADSSGERGISGALALWGPLIIIGFLVLVLNTDDAPQRPSATDEMPVTVTAPPEEPEVAAESPSAPPATQTAALEAPVEPVAESAEVPPSIPAAEPEVGSAEVDSSPAAASSEQAVATTVVEPESTEPVASAAPAPAAPETPQIAASAAEESAGEDVQSIALAEELDLDTVLEVARSVIGQAGAEAASQAVEAAPPPPPPASETPAATVTAESQIAAPSPASTAGVSTGAWGAPQPGYQAAYPVWSSDPGANVGASVPTAQGEAMWGPGTTEPGAAVGGADWPPPPESAALLPPLHPAPSMVPGSGYWPRPPVLVPCAPPYYWCIALPSPLYHPTPPVPYQ